ncbi:MAG: rhomboid family intramembrane serine protease [Candidatus Binatia bacterium]|nr:rhomboid family intramembrane serine protease [Candidatus Binatia bacterium]
MDEDLDDGLVAVLHGVPESRLLEVLALLGSEGIEADYRARDGAILVAPLDENAARRTLVDVDLSPPEPEPDKDREPTVVWSRRGTNALFAVVLVCAAVFWSTHLSGEAVTRARMLAHGAISWSLVESGELWRLLAAVFIHFDGAHILTNMLTLALIGPPLSHHLGAGRFLIVFVVSGVAGNVLSHFMVPTVGLKAGASGAVAGVLGALAGQTLRPEFRGPFRRWQVLGALGAVYALLVGAGPGKDNAAHAGGLLAGLLLGRLLTPLEARSEKPPPEGDDPVLTGPPG